MNLTDNRRTPQLYNDLGRLVLWISLLLSLATAKDWEFSKDTLNESYEKITDTGRVSFSDSISIINNTDDTIYFDSVAVEFLEPADFIDIYCWFSVRVSEPSGRFIARRDFGTGMDLDAWKTIRDWSLPPKTSIGSINVQVEGRACDPAFPRGGSLLAEMKIFTKAHGENSLYIRGDDKYYGEDIIAGIKKRRPTFQMKTHQPRKYPAFYLGKSLPR